MNSKISSREVLSSHDAERRKSVSDVLPITVLIAARNEAKNLPKCMAALDDFERVVVLDSFSSDDTATIAEGAGAEVVQFRYEGGYPKKRQWALENVQISTPWVLLLDADEVITRDFILEVRVALSEDRHDGFLVTKGFHFMGRRFRFGGFSHSAVLLFRTGMARFEHLMDEDVSAMDMEVHERLIVDGSVGTIHSPLIHEDYKGLEAYVDRHNKYSTWEARVRQLHLDEGHWGEDTITPRLLGNSQERRRFLKQIALRMPFEPVLWFLWHYVAKLGFLEGRRGLIASRIRANYIAEARSKLFELRIASQQPSILTLPQTESRATQSKRAA